MDVCELKDKDCFYTNPDIAKECLHFLYENVDKDKFTLWLEPSAGNGSFFDQLPAPKTGIDLQPQKNSEILEADFLEWHPDNSKRTITVGNPPFGKNSSLAVKFFNHAASFSHCVAMILPRTFRKDSIINRLDSRFHLKCEIEIPKNAFILGDSSYDVPCVFQIWERKRTHRTVVEKPKSHSDFHFCNRKIADFAIQRIGVNAGRFKKNVSQVSPNSHYCIQSVEVLEKVIRIFKEIDWSSVKYNTAGNPSISKSDLVLLYDLQKEAMAA